MNTPQSIGHMGFTTGYNGNVWEFYEREGMVYRAPTSNVMDTAGYRLARFESSRAHWDHYFWTVHAPMFQH